jgi:hypothetical protein
MLHWARLVHENLAVIATFAYSQAPIDAESNKHFHGGRAAFKFLHKITYEIPYERSIKALMELALYFRTLDDEQKLTGMPPSVRLFSKMEQHNPCHRAR